jgi:hypothetical protein
MTLLLLHQIFSTYTVPLIHMPLLLNAKVLTLLSLHTVHSVDAWWAGEAHVSLDALRTPVPFLAPGPLDALLSLMSLGP